MVNPINYLTLTRNNAATLSDPLKSELHSGLKRCYLSVFEQSAKVPHKSQIASVLSEYLRQFIETNNLTGYNLSTEVIVTSLLKDDVLNLNVILPGWVLSGTLKNTFCFRLKEFIE